MLDAYQKLLAPLFARSSMGMRLGLDTTRALLAALGAPDNAFDHIIVAGTNGKGSTSALLAAALTQSGLKTGLFTSPHLCSYTERIRVDGVAIEPTSVVHLMQLLQQAEAVTGLSASFFEATTLLACLHFMRSEVQVAVMECGLGGRLDATNALTDKRRHAAIITPIDLDHQHILGHDRITIATQKAAVMRPQVPAIVAAQDLAVMAYLQEHARLIEAPITLATKATHDCRPRLPGYLDENRKTARIAYEVIGQSAYPGRCSAQAFDRAVNQFVWPGRYQKLAPRRKNGPAYLIDGSHNPHGMAALCRSLAADKDISGKRLHALFAVMPHKDGAAMEALLMPQVMSMHRCQLALHPEPGVLPTAAQALQRLEASLGAGDIILIAGSLYLAGEALAQICCMAVDPPVHG